MAIPLSVSLKLDRAQEHLLAITNEVARYLDTEPYKIVRNIQPSNPKLVLLEWHVIKDPDERISVIVGDCLHNLRSSLDHLICCLVTKNRGKVSTSTQFPILDIRPIDKKTRKPLRPWIDGCVDDNILAVIDSLQPYQNGKDAAIHPLSLLRELSNADKHRLLHLCVAYLGNPDFCLTLPNGSTWTGKPNMRVAHHETPIFAIQLPTPFDISLHGKINVETQGSAFIGLKEPGPWDGVPINILLYKISEFIRTIVITKLNPFLE